MIEISRGTAYGFGLSQVAITLGFLLYFPVIHVRSYTVTALIINNTLSTVPRETNINLGIPILVMSIVAAIFSTSTYQLNEQGIGAQDYQPDVMEQVGVWDLLFWVYCMIGHLICISILINPGGVFGCISSTCFMVYFLKRSCAPKSQTINLTQENINLLGYGLGTLQVVYQIQYNSSNRLLTLGLIVMLDYFLGIGHTWDKQATVICILIFMFVYYILF